MLSEHVARADMGFAGLLMSADEYLALGETEQRYELVNGVVVMAPSSTGQHWGFVEEIMDQIRAFAVSRGGFEMYSETDLVLSPSMVFVPDLAVYLRPRPTKRPKRMTTPPDLVVEIASPGNKSYDFKTKRDAYERFGVGEYWSIDPLDRTGADDQPPGLRVRAWSLQRGSYVDLPIEADRLVSRAIAGFALDLRPLRGMSGEAE